MTDRRLSRAEQSEICRLYSQGTPTAILAKQFSVSESKLVRVLEDAGYIRW